MRPGAAGTISAYFRCVKHIRGGYTGVLVLLAAQIGTTIACTSGSEDGTGGSETGGGGTASGGGSGGGFSDGGGPAAGGGTGGSECLSITTEDDGCVCERSLEDFCSVTNCSLPDSLECGSENFSAVMIYRGCGYIYRSSWGEEESSTMWSEESGELVFRRVRYSQTWDDACPTKQYGERPECDSWEEACDLGYGGMGGWGGMGGLGGDAP